MGEAISQHQVLILSSQDDPIKVSWKESLIITNDQLKELKQLGAIQIDTIMLQKAGDVHFSISRPLGKSSTAVLVKDSTQQMCIIIESQTPHELKKEYIMIEEVSVLTT